MSVFSLPLDKEVGGSAVQAALLGFSFVFGVGFIPLEGGDTACLLGVSILIYLPACLTGQDPG